MDVRGLTLREPGHVLAADLVKGVRHLGGRMWYWVLPGGLDVTTNPLREGEDAWGIVHAEPVLGLGPWRRQMMGG